MSETNAEYAELKHRITERGLLEKQYAYYAFKIVSTAAFLVLALTMLVMIDSVWLQALGAAFLAFVFVQLGLLGHDAGHQQIFRLPRNNDLIGLGVCLFLGVSRSWWVDKHNQHHGNPNDPDLDPDLNIPGISFTAEQARAKKGFLRWLGKYQAYYFPLMLSLEGIGVRLASILFLIRGKKIKYPGAEPILMALHFALYFGLLFYLMNGWYALAFIIVHQGLFGLYLGSVFAPNHKGMLMLDKDSNLDFLRQQVLTARNVKGRPLIDFLYGGLNYQIEHHLFPNMPRNKLKEAQVIVRAFCEERSIPYYETNPLQSFREILESLHETALPLRQGHFQEA